MPLKYKIKRRRARGAVTLEATPNEWACDIRATVVYRNRFNEATAPVPRVEHIGWSTGARNWTIGDARKFFQAGLVLLDEAEKELINHVG